MYVYVYVSASLHFFTYMHTYAHTHAYTPLHQAPLRHLIPIRPSSYTHTHTHTYTHIHTASSRPHSGTLYRFGLTALLFAPELGISTPFSVGLGIFDQFEEFRFASALRCGTPVGGLEPVTAVGLAKADLLVCVCV